MEGQQKTDLHSMLVDVRGDLCPPNKNIIEKEIANKSDVNLRVSIHCLLWNLRSTQHDR